MLKQEYASSYKYEILTCLINKFKSKSTKIPLHKIPELLYFTKITYGADT